MRVCFFWLIAPSSLLLACILERRVDEVFAAHGVTWEPDTSTSTSTGSSTGGASTSTGPGESGAASSDEGTVGGTVTLGSGAGSTVVTEAGGEMSTGEPECGDGVVEADEMCDDGNEEALDGCNECVRESLMFVSSEIYQGKDFGGLFGADQRCRSLAAKAGLRRYETFKAWLSDSAESAADRLIHSKGRYVLVNGLRVADDWEELTSGALQRGIDVTEKSETYLGPVWTGTLIDGTTAAGATQCEGWTVIKGDTEAGRGSSAYKDAFWTHVGLDWCGGGMPMYCVEQ